MEYIVDNNNVRFLGFQFDLVRQTRTISVYVNDILKEYFQQEANAVFKLMVYFWILLKYNVNGVDVAAGITSKSKISH